MADFIEDPPGFPTKSELAQLPPEDQIGWLVEWFGHNYADPVHEMPYNTREGGYQYIWGGPYDAREELSGFSVSDEVIEAAAEIVQREAFDWAPSPRRTGLMHGADNNDDVRLEIDPEDDTDATRRTRPSGGLFLATEDGTIITTEEGEPIVVEPISDTEQGVPFDDGSYFDDGTGFDNGAYGTGPYGGEPTSTPSDERSARRLVRLDLLRMRSLLDKAPPSPTRAHNNPPELIEDERLTTAINQLAEAVQSLSEQAQKEEPSKQDVQKSQGLLMTAYVAIGSVAGELLKEAGSIALDKYWDQILTVGAQLAHHVSQWVSFLF